jgi:hypothetical protein
VADQVADTAVDNDVVLKAICFRLVDDFWPEIAALGVLGAAPYVLRDAIGRPNVKGVESDLRKALDEFFSHAVALEPTSAEIDLAADLELEAQRSRLDLDPGESQLAAIAIERSLRRLVTGDKRAIKALEGLIDPIPRMETLTGRVQCLEQLVLEVLDLDSGHERAQEGICAESNLDKALAISFGCASGGNSTKEEAVEGLMSYIRDLQANAPRLLDP